MNYKSIEIAEVIEDLEDEFIKSIEHSVSELSLTLNGTKMNDDIKIIYSTPGSIALPDLTYVIIGARENGKWIFVRHRERESWELPAGHIEKGETAEAAALRELYEETGATESSLKVLYDYSVSSNGSTSHGRIFYAEIKRRGPVPESEIAEIKIAEISPEPATYPEPHKSFMGVLEKYLKELDSK